MPSRPTYRRRLLATALALAGCGDATGPAPLPAGAASYTPPPVYARWWTLVEACSGLTGDFAAYAWYAAPGATVRTASGREAAAYTDPAARRVVLAAKYRDDGPTVRHEMLHALLGPAYADPARWHPPAYFQGRCEGVVVCDAVGCQDAGPAPASAPADAPTAAVSALDVRVDVLPTPTSRTGADTLLSVIVRVTNPGPGPVWVPLEPSPDQSPTATEVGGFGYEIAPAGGGPPYEGVWQLVARGRIPFAAGQTRRYVFDVNAAGYPAGDYAALGRYNTRETSTGFRVAP